MSRVDRNAHRGSARPGAEGLAAPLIRGTLAVLLALVACASTTPHPAYVPQPTGALVEVERPPPPPRVEVLPARPAARSVWIDGEWTWRRGRWAWLVGRWVEPPPGARFSPWAFVRAPNGTLYFAPGAWRDTRGSVVEAPAALALAAVQSTEVVDADGTVVTTGPTLSDRPRSASRPAD
ncbi:MAG: hypothetical protein ABTD50_02675 [Polyangiaceae bacterium]